MLQRAVSIMSRKEALRYCEGKHANPTIMISVSDPRMFYRSIPFITQENGIREILPLSFADADHPGTDVYRHAVSTDDLIQDEDAEQIAALLCRHPRLPVIVHCDAGISRSAGIGAAILKYYNRDDSPVFDNPIFHPNMLCYRKTLEALIHCGGTPANEALDQA